MKLVHLGAMGLLGGSVSAKFMPNTDFMSHVQKENMNFMTRKS